MLSEGPLFEGLFRRVMAFRLAERRERLITFSAIRLINFAVRSSQRLALLASLL